MPTELRFHAQANGSRASEHAVFFSSPILLPFLAVITPSSFTVHVYYLAVRARVFSACMNQYNNNCSSSTTCVPKIFGFHVETSCRLDGSRVEREEEGQ